MDELYIREENGALEPVFKMLLDNNNETLQ